MDAEVIIIGGGPAGNQCALELANKGIPVIVLEQGSAHDSTYFPCLMGPKLEAKFGEYPANLIEGECGFYRLVASKEFVDVYANATHPPQPHLGHFANKSAISAWEREQATDAGAQFHFNTRATQINVSQDQVEVQTDNSDSPQVTGRVVVFATGIQNSSNAIQKLLQIPVPKTIYAVWRTYQLPGGYSTEPDHMCLIWNPKISQHAYAAYYQYSSGFYIGLLDYGRSPLEMTNVLREVCERHKVIAPLLEGATQTTLIGQNNLYEIPREIIQPTFKDRILITGDAAGFVNNFVREGLFQAKLSGLCVAETILDAQNTGDYRARNLAGYERRWKETLDEANLRPGRASAYLFYETGKLDTVANALIAALKQEQKYNKTRFQSMFLSTMISPVYSRANDVEWTKALLGAMNLADKTLMTPRFLKAAFVK
jgi:flavin-dependent dehydrogenase